MSVTVTTTITCTRCGFHSGWTRTEGPVSATDARLWAQRRGWLVHRATVGLAAVDYCPECAKDERGES